jgi:hypothetical protein
MSTDPPTRKPDSAGAEASSSQRQDPDADEPGIAKLTKRQHAQEVAERERLAEADTAAEAKVHRRRADKAHYLREKLEQRERADREAADDEDNRELPADDDE